MNIISNTKEIYINGYARLDFFYKIPRLAKVLKITKKFIPKYINRILGIGCGDGTFSIALGNIVKSEEIFGIDISHNAIKEAIKHNIKAYVFDIDNGKHSFYCFTRH